MGFFLCTGFKNCIAGLHKEYTEKGFMLLPNRS